MEHPHAERPEPIPAHPRRFHPFASRFARPPSLCGRHWQKVSLQSRPIPVYCTVHSCSQTKMLNDAEKSTSSHRQTLIYYKVHTCSQNKNKKMLRKLLLQLQMLHCLSLCNRLAVFSSVGCRASPRLSLCNRLVVINSVRCWAAFLPGKSSSSQCSEIGGKHSQT